MNWLYGVTLIDFKLGKWWDIQENAALKGVTTNVRGTYLLLIQLTAAADLYYFILLCAYLNKLLCYLQQCCKYPEQSIAHAVHLAVVELHKIPAKILRKASGYIAPARSPL